MTTMKKTLSTIATALLMIISQHKKKFNIYVCNNKDDSQKELAGKKPDKYNYIPQFHLYGMLENVN